MQGSLHETEENHAGESDKLCIDSVLYGMVFGIQMGRKTVIVGTHSVMHAVVDFGCAALVMGIAREVGLSLPLAVTVIVLYDFCAFALQFPVGILTDRLNCNSLIAAIGCVLVALGFLLRPWAVTACVIAGIGNALYHVGGGVDVLNLSDRKAALSGIFVSTGDLGLFLGVNANRLPIRATVIFILLLVSAAILLGLYYLIKCRYRIENVPCKRLIEPVSLSDRQKLILVCMMSTVYLRSCFGVCMSFSWRSAFTGGLIAASAIMLGKMLGGIVGDRLGWMKTSVSSLLLAAVLFVFAEKSMVCGLAALLLFNMTMPITLCVTVDLFRNRKGAAFGLTSAMLFFGLIPAFDRTAELLEKISSIVAGAVVSAALLLIGLIAYRKWRTE